MLHSMDRDAKWLAWFEQQFSNLAGSDRQIDIEEFKEALHVKEVIQSILSLLLSLKRWFCFVLFSHSLLRDSFTSLTKTTVGPSA